MDLGDIGCVDWGGRDFVMTLERLPSDTFGLPGEGRRDRRCLRDVPASWRDFSNPYLERHGIFSCNRRGAEFHEVGIVGGVQGEYRFALGQGVSAQRLGLASPFGVGN